MQLALDSLDRLVALVEERGPVGAVEAARTLLAARAVPEGLACSLLADVVAGDARLRLVAGSVALAAPAADVLLEEAELVVFDLETTGLSPATSRICEIGAARVRALEVVDGFESLVDPGVQLPPQIGALTGLRQADLAGAPRVEWAVRRFLEFAGGAPLVAHNARFDAAFLDRQLERLTGRRLAEPPLDTAALARRLLEGRVRRKSLSSLAEFFGVSVEPCHRALPDAQATAEVLVHLIGLAQERGARTLGDLRALAAPRARRIHGKRRLVGDAPARPGVYLFLDASGQVLYVGRARDLRARLRTYFHSDRQRPSVEAALLALDRVEWRVLGSEVEAALEELHLIRELQPPANARSRRPDRGVYLRRTGEGVGVSSQPTPLGPIGSRRRAELAARALAGATPEELDALLAGGPLPRLHARLAELAECLRYEEAARLRDRIAALEDVVERLARLDRARRAELCLLVPGAEPGCARAFFLAGGRVCASRPVVAGAGARVEVEAGLAAARAAVAEGPSLRPDDAEDVLVLLGLVERRAPELTVLPLDAEAILAAAVR